MFSLEKNRTGLENTTNLNIFTLIYLFLLLLLLLFFFSIIIIITQKFNFVILGTTGSTNSF
jgi:hypothetical protein